MVVKAVGLEVNESNERIRGRSRVQGGSVVDDGIWMVDEPHPDGGGWTAAFGSYLDSVPYTCHVSATQVE